MAQRITIALRLCLLITVSLVNPFTIITKPTLLKSDAQPSGVIFSSIVTTSLFECASACNLNTSCWRYCFTGTICQLYDPPTPTQNQKFLQAKDCTLYQVRKKVFKLIRQPHTHNSAMVACKKTFGSRLACLSDPESLQLYGERFGWDGASCNSQVLVGLHSKGNAGIFEWANGVQIDVVNGTGLQNWSPGKKLEKYKSEDVVVCTEFCKKPWYWYELSVDRKWWPVCEIP